MSVCGRRSPFVRVGGSARRVLRGCARECDWVARALLVLRLMGVVGGGVFGVCGFRSPARAPCLGVR